MLADSAVTKAGHADDHGGQSTLLLPWTGRAGTRQGWSTNLIEAGTYRFRSFEPFVPFPLAPPEKLL